MSSLRHKYYFDKKIEVFSDAFLHIEANDYNNGNLIQTTDKTGNSFSPNNVNVASDILNSNKALQFNGVSSYIDYGKDFHIIGDSGSTIFIVGKSNSPTGWYLSKSAYSALPKRYAIGYDSSLLYSAYNGEFSYISRNVGTDELISVKWDRISHSNRLYVNGILMENFYLNDDSVNLYNFLIGAYANSIGDIPPQLYLSGNIYEIIVYKEILDNSLIDSKNNELKTKYGIL